MGADMMQNMAKPEFQEAMQQMGRGVSQIENYFRPRWNQIPIQPRDPLMDLKRKALRAQLDEGKRRRQAADAAAEREAKWRKSLATGTTEVTPFEDPSIDVTDEPGEAVDVSALVTQQPSWGERQGIDPMTAPMGVLENIATRKPEKPPELQRKLIEAGYVPGTPEYEQAARQILLKPGTQITMQTPKNRFGTIPPGHQLLGNDEEGYRIARLPGHPNEAKEAAAAQESQQRRQAKATGAAEKANTMLTTIGNLRDLKKNSKFDLFGTVSNAAGLYSGSPQGMARSYVASLKSGVVLSAMMRLKDASKQGATGFGQMNEKELQVLIDTLGALNPNDTDDKIMFDTLGRIEDQYERIVRKLRQTPMRYIREWGLEPLLDGLKRFGDGGKKRGKPLVTDDGWSVQ
jgi:hypothetical protein